MHKTIAAVIWPQGNWTLERLGGQDTSELLGGYSVGSIACRGNDGRILYGEGGQAYYGPGNRAPVERPANTRGLRFIAKWGETVFAHEQHLGGPVAIIGNDYGMWSDVEDWVVDELLLREEWCECAAGMLIDAGCSMPAYDGDEWIMDSQDVELPTWVAVPRLCKRMDAPAHLLEAMKEIRDDH